jgi:hypothetical protein
LGGEGGGVFGEEDGGDGGVGEGPCVACQCVLSIVGGEGEVDGEVSGGGGGLPAKRPADVSPITLQAVIRSILV